MEIIANGIQTLPIGANVIFTDTPIKPSKCIRHRDGSGLITLKGATNQCVARYFVAFSGNVAVPEDGVTGDVSLAIALDGEALAGTNMIETLANVNIYRNVATFTYIEVPKNCCASLAVRNTSATPINVQTANLIAVRVA